MPLMAKVVIFHVTVVPHSQLTELCALVRVWRIRNADTYSPQPGGSPAHRSQAHVFAVVLATQANTWATCLDNTPKRATQEMHGISHHLCMIPLLSMQRTTLFQPHEK